MQRLILGVLLCLGTSCATSPLAEGPQSSDKFQLSRLKRIDNRSDFDVAACQAPPSTPTVSNEGTVVGALVTSRPFLFECLVDSKHRGPGVETRVVVDSVVTTAGARHQVSGSNLTTEGTACIEAALARAVKLPVLEKGAKSVKGQVELLHVANVHSSVTLGNGEASDILGAIRLAQPTWCDCYASFTESTPATVKAWFKVPRGSSNVSGVVWVAPGETRAPAGLLGATTVKQLGGPSAAAQAAPDTPEVQELSRCLTGKLEQL
ncbi:MAG: hypothetical protein L0Y66_09010, partial [Myxococcaceae bacterium]|nr:hypothetical protein [Myxococcaceae bacterium]